MKTFKYITHGYDSSLRIDGLLRSSVSTMRIGTWLCMLIFSVLIVGGCGGANPANDSSWGALPPSVSKPIADNNSDGDGSVIPDGDEGGERASDPFAILDRTAFVDGLTAAAATIQISDEASADASQAERVVSHVKSVEGRTLACISYAIRISQCYAGKNFNLSVFMDVHDKSPEDIKANEAVEESCKDYAEFDSGRYDRIDVDDAKAFIETAAGDESDSLAELIDGLDCAAIHEISVQDEAVLGMFSTILPELLNKENYVDRTFGHIYAGAIDGLSNVFSRSSDVSDGRAILNAKIRFLNGAFDSTKQRLIVVWENNLNLAGGSLTGVKWGEFVVSGEGDIKDATLYSQFGTAPTRNAIARTVGHQGISVGHLVVINRSSSEFVPRDGARAAQLFSIENNHSNLNSRWYDFLKAVNKIDEDKKTDDDAIEIGHAMSSSHALVFSAIYRSVFQREPKLMRSWQGHYEAGRVYCVEAITVEGQDYSDFHPAIHNGGPEKEFPKDGSFNGCATTDGETKAILDIDLGNRRQIDWLGNTPASYSCLKNNIY